VPPFDPAQVQAHGPVPLIALAVARRTEIGGRRRGKVPPLAEPHCPFDEKCGERYRYVQLAVTDS